MPKEVSPKRLSDGALLNWLQKNEVQLRSHRERVEDGWEIWWVCVKRGKSITHPYGNVRTAIWATQQSVEAHGW